MNSLRNLAKSFC